MQIRKAWGILCAPAATCCRLTADCGQMAAVKIAGFIETVIPHPLCHEMADIIVTVAVLRLEMPLDHGLIGFRMNIFHHFGATA